MAHLCPFCSHVLDSRDGPCARCDKENYEAEHREQVLIRDVLDLSLVPLLHSVRRFLMPHKAE